jgi:hypothetical protein
MPEVPIVATEGVPLLQVHPAVAEDKVVVPPIHMLIEPVIAAGKVPTDTTVTLRQLVARV